MGNPDGPKILHGPAQHAAIYVLVADKLDLTNFNLGSFPDHEGNAYRSRGDGPDLGADGGKLPPVFRQQLLHGDLGFFNFCRIVLTLHRKSYFALLEAVQHIAGRDGAQAHVVDLANGGPFLDIDVDDPALRRLLAFKLDIFKITGVPEGIEVALEGHRVINVAGPRKDTGSDRFCRNAPVPVDLDARNHVLLCPTLGTKKCKHHQEKQ